MPTPKLAHNTFTNIPANQFDTVSADVIGVGLYAVGPLAALEFQHGVGDGQNIILSNYHPGAAWGESSLLVDDPANFHANVILAYFTPPRGAPAAEQSSVGFLTRGGVDSYSLRNNTLDLWGGNKIVDAVKLYVADPYGITVQNVPGGLGWTYVSANTATQHGISSAHGISPGIPIHV